MPPAFGVLLSAEYPMTELADLGKLSEDLGYKYFWYVDARYRPECYLGLAAVAAKTEKILLGTGVTDPFSRHPAITAVSIATLDEMSNGRAILGLGAGGATIKALGIDWKLPVAALRECVDVVQRLLRGESVTHEGKVVQLQGGKLAFKPLRSEIPIYFATQGAQVSKLAGRVADGVLLANTVEEEELRPFLANIKEGLDASGRPLSAFDTCVRVEASISDDEEAAFAVMKGRAVQRLMNEYPHWGFLEQRGVTLPQELYALAEQKAPASEAAKLMPNEVVARLVLAGSPERVAERIAGILVPEVTQICIRPHVTPGQNVAEAIETFAKRVMPRAIELSQKAAAAAR